MSKPIAAIILAAGKGTRMKSSLAKVLHPLCGNPLLYYPLATAKTLACSPIAVVVGHGAAEVQNHFSNEDVIFAEQKEQLGTGHALMMAEDALRNFTGDILLLCGDVPLLTVETLQQLQQDHQKSKAVVTVLTAHVKNPAGYGRIVRQQNSITAIVEQKDATVDELKICEVNTGVYLFDARFIFEALKEISTDNAQGEYYLTDAVSIAKRKGLLAQAAPYASEEEFLGINDRVQLAEASTILKRRINDCHMRAGVSMPDPDRTYIDYNVDIGPDTLIAPGAHVQGISKIGSNCIIETGSVIIDASIADNVHIKNGSRIQAADISSGCSIGPMAHLRPGTILKGNNKIGNFVETKKAILGKESQASHLTYLGDTEVGERVNFGCGTITCNYDGVNKHKTIVGDDVFVGSDSQFVAPVTIGSNSLIAAGSTITKDVPADALALSRTDQKTIAGWSLRKKKSKE